MRTGDRHVAVVVRHAKGQLTRLTIDGAQHTELFILYTNSFVARDLDLAMSLTITGRRSDVE